MTRLPDFLVIGAQKCGTTTLYEDLRSHPSIAMPEKESSGLLSARSAHEYARLFPDGDGVVGEIATTYSMQPEVDVVGRAHELVPEARIVYIVREPLARTISHHHHDFALGLVGPDIDVAVREHPPLVQNSRYATQLWPWLAAYGPERVRVIRFEDYVRDRVGECARLCRFLDLSPHTFDATLVANAAGDKVVASGAWATLSASRPYRALVRPLMSERARRLLMARVLPKAPPRPEPPSRATVDHLVATLKPEVEELARQLSTERWWDLEAEADRMARPDHGPA
jgi:Sulfotransferase domain